jgi:hypothetical protein
MHFNVSRFIWLFAFGVLLAPLAGYAGALVLFPIVIAWLMHVSLFFVGAGVPPTFIDDFFIPALYGIEWAWPTTCFVLPIFGAITHRPNMLAPIAGAMAGMISGILTGTAAAKLQPDSIAAVGTTYFVLAAFGAGGIVGAAFGFVIWRTNTQTERLQSVNGSAA